MKETIKRLEIAFMGYDTQQTKAAFQRFARDNQEEIRTDLLKMGLLTLKDGTRITAITPGTAGSGICAYKYDQLILADDSRKRIYSARWREISLFLQTAITPGIYQYGNPQKFGLYINGIKKADFSGRTAELDITDLLTGSDNMIPRGSWLSLEVRPDDLAYISIDLIVQGFIQSRGDKTV